MKTISRKSYCIIWIISLSIIIAVNLHKLWGLWGDTYWFLVELPKFSPINLPAFDGLRVLHASRGVPLLISNIVFFIILIIYIVRLKKEISSKSNMHQ